MTRLPQDFADLLVELREAQAEFLLVGGWAVISRMSKSSSG
ncbi:MAG TPA: hypothetical protein VEQ58_19375 [Polyangiaceae bacterium]|nr:hypothetical protein [Polyangiaceae bacterium]